MEYTEYLVHRNEIIDWLKKRLKDPRFQHTLGVEMAAVMLAKHYHAPLADASLAALLHDNAKNLPLKEQKHLAEKNFPGLAQDDHFSSVYHAFAGAVSASNRFSYLSQDILNAICFHTTGRPAMTTLEKIIYIADYIEPGREAFPALHDARRLAYEDLDRAIIYILEQTNAYLTQKGKIIHPLSEEALRYYQQKEKNHDGS